VADDVRSLSDQLARDPASLVFLELAETLRARGQLDAATKVVMAGLSRHPQSAAAHDLHARVLADRADLPGAERAWQATLEIDGRHLGAHKGLGFLCFKKGDVEGALDHLELALSIDPTDVAVVQALKNVRGTSDLPMLAPDDPEPEIPESARPTPREGTPAPVSSIPGAAPVPTPSGAGRTTQEVFIGLEGADRGLLLVDARGRVLGGAIRGTDGQDVSEETAAHLAGVAQEAVRATRVLGLGGWSWIVAEGPGGNLFLSPPTPETTLLVVRDRSVPSGRLAVLAEKAREVAARWIEEAGQL